MEEKRDITETIHKVLWGKSSNPFAEENVNDADFQAGYTAGDNDPSRPGLHSQVWMDAWMKTYNETNDQKWKSWKRGYHSARLANVIAKNYGNSR